MSGFIVMPVWALEDNELSPASFKLFAALCRHRDKAGWCWPKIKSLMAATGQSERWVYVQLRNLADLGYIERHQVTARSGARTGTRYRVLFDAPPVRLLAAIEQDDPDEEPLQTDRENAGGAAQSCRANNDELTNENYEKQKKGARARESVGEGGDIILTPELRRRAHELGFDEARQEAERLKCLAYWRAYPDKAPRGDPAQAFIGWLMRAKPPAAIAGTPAAATDPAPQPPAVRLTAAPDVPAAWAEAWQRVGEILAASIGAVPVKSWFERLTLERDGDDLTRAILRAPTAFHADYVNNQFAAALHRAWAAEFPDITARLIPPEKKHGERSTRAA